MINGERIYKFVDWHWVAIALATVLTAILGFWGKTTNDRLWDFSSMLSQQTKALEHLATAFDNQTEAIKQVRGVTDELARDQHQDEKETNAVAGQLTALGAKVTADRADLDSYMVRTDNRLEQIERGSGSRK
jgi:hypothetical protein